VTGKLEVLKANHVFPSRQGFMPGA
jgi:hypothetical protein